MGSLRTEVFFIITLACFFFCSIICVACVQQHTPSDQVRVLLEANADLVQHIVTALVSCGLVDAVVLQVWILPPFPGGSGLNPFAVNSRGSCNNVYF